MSSGGLSKQQRRCRPGRSGAQFGQRTRTRSHAGAEQSVHPTQDDASLGSARHQVIQAGHAPSRLVLHRTPGSDAGRGRREQRQQRATTLLARRHGWRRHDHGKRASSQTGQLQTMSMSSYLLELYCCEWYSSPSGST